MTDTLKEELSGKSEKQTWAICEKPFNIAGIKRTSKGKDLAKENYLWRSLALKEQLDLEQLASTGSSPWGTQTARCGSIWRG